MNAHTQTESITISSSQSSSSLNQGAMSHSPCFLLLGPLPCPSAVLAGFYFQSRFQFQILCPHYHNPHLTDLLNLASEKQHTDSSSSLYHSSLTKQPKLELDTFQQSSSDNVCALFNLTAPTSCRIQGIT